MIIYILHFSISRNKRSLQEFQSTCRQGITWTVAFTDAAITNMHFLFFTTFICDSEGLICILLRLNTGKKKAIRTEAFIYFQCFHSFQIFKVSFLKIKMQLAIFLKIPEVICFINVFSKISNYVIISLNLWLCIMW